MKEPHPEAIAPILAEMLYFHAALGRGYVSPFPPINGLVFTSALHPAAVAAFAAAEKRFRNWHAGKIEDVKKEIAQVKNQPKAALDNPKLQERLKALEEQVSKMPYVTRTASRMNKDDMIDMLVKSYYGAYTYFSASGSRLTGVLTSAHSRLSAELDLRTLTEGSNDESFTRATGTAGTSINTLSGTEPVFNYFISTEKDKSIYHLQDRIRDSLSGESGIGYCALIPGPKALFTGTSYNVLNDLMMKVYAKGELEPDKRVKVMFDMESEMEWRKFLNWGLRDLIEEDGELAEWQQKMASMSPATPQLAVLFGGRAAMVNAFLTAAECTAKGGPINEVFLGKEELEWAKRFAKYIFVKSSGYDKMQVRLENLKKRTGADNHITEHKLKTARLALAEAICNSENERISRYQTRDIPGVTYGLLDELVRRGEIIELRGVEECRMGKTQRAYTLAEMTVGNGEEESYAEFLSYEEEFANDPDIVEDRDAFIILNGIRAKAVDFHQQHFMPVVPLSKMSSMELRALPKILKKFDGSVLLRGKGRIPEPEKLMDEETPLDIEGCNLWVRHHPEGHEFLDWDKAGKLKLAEHWGSEQEVPDVVPA